MGGAARDGAGQLARDGVGRGAGRRDGAGRGAGQQGGGGALQSWFAVSCMVLALSEL